MDSLSLNIIIRGIEKVLTPMLHVYLKFGGSYTAFDDLTKRIFIKVAQKHFSPSNAQKASERRISTVTGMSRTMVKATLARLQENEEIVANSGKDFVISAWMTDKDFLNEKGEPRALTVTGITGFSDLVEQYTSQINTQLVVESLLSLGVISKDNHNVELVAPEKADPSHPYQDIVITWQNNSRFTGYFGKPRVLPIMRKQGFNELCKKYAGDLRATDLLEYLLELGICREVSTKATDGETRYQLVTVGVVPVNSTPHKIRIGLEHTADLAKTVTNNILNSKSQAFQEKALIYRNIPKEYLPELHQSCAQSCDKLLVSYDSVFQAVDRDYNSDVDGTGTYKAGFYCFYYHEEITEEL